MGSCLSSSTAAPKRRSVAGKTIRHSLNDFMSDHDPIPINLVPAGSKFSDLYELGAVLGSGGFSTVYSATPLKAAVPPRTKASPQDRLLKRNQERAGSPVNEPPPAPPKKGASKLFGPASPSPDSSEQWNPDAAPTAASASVAISCYQETSYGRNFGITHTP